MDRPLFIGDELTAVGFRLPGIEVVMPEPDRVAEVFDQGLNEAPLVMITTTLAGMLPDDRLIEAVKQARPPVAVVPDAAGATPLPDMAQRVRLALGVAT